MTDEVATQVAEASIPGPEPTAAPAAEVSIRDSVKSALAEVSSREGETPEQRADRQRDEQGRFAAKEAAKRETLTLKKGAEAAKTETAPAAPAAVKVPDSWKDASAEFTALDPKLQARIAKREADMHRQFTTQDEERLMGKRIREIAQPYEAIMRSEGSTVEESFRSLMNAAYVMRTGSPEQKRQLLLGTARAYNIDLGVPLQPVTVESEILELRRQVAALKQPQQQAPTQQRQIPDAALKAELDAFEASNPEHYELVKPIMATILQNGQAESYQDAHSKALEQIRSNLVDPQLKAAEEKRQAQQKIDAAKRAAGSVTGSPGGVKPSNGNGAVSQSLRDEIRANIRAADGRV